MHPFRLGFGWLLVGATAVSAQTYTFAPLVGVSSHGSADGIASQARFAFPLDVAVDADGNVFVADTRNHTIRRIAPTGLVTTVAGMAGQSGSADGSGTAARFKEPQGIALDAAGTLYVADGNLTIRKVSAAGLVTTLAGAAIVVSVTQRQAGTRLDLNS